MAISNEVVSGLHGSVHVRLSAAEYQAFRELAAEHYGGSNTEAAREAFRLLAEQHQKRELEKAS